MSFNLLFFIRLMTDVACFGNKDIFGRKDMIKYFIISYSTSAKKCGYFQKGAI